MGQSEAQCSHTDSVPSALSKGINPQGMMLKKRNWFLQLFKGGKGSKGTK